MDKPACYADVCLKLIGIDRQQKAKAKNTEWMDSEKMQGT